MLAALVRKTQRIREELGSIAQVIDNRLGLMMKTGIRSRVADELVNEIDSLDLDSAQRAVVEEELEAARERKLDLQKQLDTLRTMLKKSQDEIAFSKEHFRAAISCSLSLVNAAPLKPATPQDDNRFIFPALEQRQGADPTWATTMDSLRPTGRPRCVHSRDAGCQRPHQSQYRARTQPFPWLVAGRTRRDYP